MSINPIGSRTSSGALPIGATVQGIVSDPAFIQMNGQIVNKSDYPKLHTAFDSIPKPRFEDQAVPAFGTTDIYDITYGNSKYVAIAEGGKFATSPDGVTWTLQAGTITATVLSFANGIFYAGGIGGKLYSSTDGITWTQRLSVSGNKFGRVVYNGSNGYFVSGTNGDIYSSTNGTTWNIDVTLNPSTQSGTHVSDIIWDSTTSRLYGIICESGGIWYRWRYTWSGTDLVSDALDATNITGFSGTTDYPANILKFGSTYVAFGKIAGSYKVITSSDLITWSDSATGLTTGSSSNYKLAQDGSTRIVLVKSSSLLTSTSPSTSWTVQTSSFGSSNIRGIARGSSAWAAVGQGNKIATATNTAVTWTQQSSPFTTSTTIQSNDITNDGVSTWMVVGNSGKVAYGDGGSWLESTTGLANAINGVAYGEGTWVLATTTEVPKYSTNLTSWTNVTGLPSATYNYIKYSSGSGNFIAYRASTGMYYSADGITWTASTTVFTLTTTADAVTSNSSLFVAVDGNNVYTSSDGNTWVTQVLSSLTLRNVYWNGTYFIASGTSAATSHYRSTDGVSWELITSNQSILPTGVGDGVFYSASYISEDGINWFDAAGYGQTTNMASLSGTVIACGNGVVKNGVSYDYDKTLQIYVPLAPNQTATLRTYVKAK